MIKFVTSFIKQALHERAESTFEDILCSIFLIYFFKVGLHHRGVNTEHFIANKQGLHQTTTPFPAPTKRPQWGLWVTPLCARWGRCHPDMNTTAAVADTEKKKHRQEGRM